MEHEKEKPALSIETLLNQISSQLNNVTDERNELKAEFEKIQQQQEKIIELLQTNSHLEINNKLVAEETRENQDIILPNSPIDYSILEQLLAEKKWFEADEKTAKIMIKIAQQEAKGYLTLEDFPKIPNADLIKIDQLWEKASEGRFSLKLQKQIYQSMGGTKFLNQQRWQIFAETVGWCFNGSWLSYDQLNFSEQAPPGHLPVMGDSQVWFIGGWEGSSNGFLALASRLSQCGL